MRKIYLLQVRMMERTLDGMLMSKESWRHVYACLNFEDALNDARRCNKLQWQEIRENDCYYGWFYRVVKISLY